MNGAKWLAAVVLTAASVWAGLKSLDRLLKHPPR